MRAPIETRLCLVAAFAADTLRRNRYVERTPEVDQPTGFSTLTHKLASSASTANGAVENVTHKVAETVLSAAGSVGEWVGAKLGAVTPVSFPTNVLTQNSDHSIKELGGPVRRW